MANEEYTMEHERRVNTLVTEVATLRETVRNNKESNDRVERTLSDIQSTLTNVKASNDRMEFTLKFNIEQVVAAALIPIKSELELRKEESIIRKTQIAMWAFLGGAIPTLLAVITYAMKLWGN